MTLPLVVVDDDELDRYIVQRVVKSLDLDVKVVEFSLGSDFLDTIVDEQRRTNEISPTPPAILVLLDINMPGVDGFEVLEKLKDELPDEQTLFVTMYSSSNQAEDRADVSQYDFVVDYIVKPVTAEKLKAVLDKVYPEI